MTTARHELAVGWAIRDWVTFGIEIQTPFRASGWLLYVMVARRGFFFGWIPR